MSPELDQYLCKKYPKIFSERNKSPQESCMHWGLECGDGWFSILDTLCGSIQRRIDRPPPQPVKGWKKLSWNAKQLWNLTVWNKIIYPLVNGLPYEKYKKHSKRWQFSSGYSHEPAPEGYVPQVVFGQVKEKISALRIYYSGGDEYTEALIEFAEQLSMKTCEVCGRMDETVGRNKHGWIKTTCVQHSGDVSDFYFNNPEIASILSDKEKQNETNESPKI